MTNTPLKNNAGFTLVEVMVAIVVLAIGILGAGSMQISVLNDNAKSFDRTEATALALDQVEKIMSWDYDAAGLTDLNTAAAPAAGAAPAPPVAAANINYTRIGDQLVSPGVFRITTINSTADSSITSGSYITYLDITDNYMTSAGVLTSSRPPAPDDNSVSKTIRVDVVWREGANLKTVSMNYIKTRY